MTYNPRKKQLREHSRELRIRTPDPANEHTTPRALTLKLVLGRLFQQILGHVGNGVDDDAADLVLLARRDGHEVLVELGFLLARVADPPGRDLDFARHVERVKDELPHAAVVALGVRDGVK